MNNINRVSAFEGNSSSIKRRYEYAMENFNSYQDVILDKYIYLGITSIKDDYLRGFYLATYLSETEWSKRFWHYANELNRIIFDLSLNVDKEVVLDYDGKQQTVKGFYVGQQNLPYIYNCWDWRKWVHQSLITRDERQLNNLRQLDTEIMFGKIAQYRSLNPDAIDPITHDFYMLLLNKEYVRASEILRTIIEKITTSPRSCFKNYAFIAEKRDAVDLLLIPFYRCLESVLDNNQTLFDERLYDSLQKHKDWTMVKLRSPKNSLYTPNYNEPEGFVSIPLLAACSIAYDNGMSINVESDYIPEWLYKNDGHLTTR